MTSNDIKNQAELLKVLGHPTRLCIMQNLMEKEHCNVTFMHNCLNIPQSTVSQHIAKLKSYGIISGTRKGLEINYKIIDKRAIEIIKALNSTKN